MSTRGLTVRLVMTATGKTDIAPFVKAAQAEGWDVSTVDSLGRLREMIYSERCDAAIIATDRPQELPADVVRELLAYASETPVFFLLPDGYDVTDWPATIGATSDQISSLNTLADQLMKAVGQEVQCSRDNRPEYVVMCVDDDQEFLASLKSLLSPSLKLSFTRLKLDIQFFDKPIQALAELESLKKPLAVAICDQVMPEMQGLDLLEKVKALCPAAQRVLLTGFAGMDSAVRAVNEQLLNKYLTKPIDEPIDFINIVQHLVQEYHLQRTAAAQRQRLMAQFEFIRIITGAAKLEKVFEVVTRFLLRQLGVCWSALFLWETDRPVLRAAAGQAPDFDCDAGRKIVSDLGRRAAVLRLPELLQHYVSAASKPARSDLLSTFVLPLRTQQTLLGVILAGDGLSDREFTRDERLLTSFVANVAAMTIGRFNDHQALESYYVGTMASLMDVVEAKDQYTRGHTDRVVELAIALGKAAGMGEAELKNLHYAAALHDLGKLAVPEAILGKPGRLEPSELAVIKEHPSRADTILSHLRFLDSARLIIRSHHERYDGKGYPDGLAGEEIPLGGRILAIVDSYDAMTSNRPYRNSMSPADALAEIRAGAGTQFEPALAAIFVQMMGSRGIARVKTGRKPDAFTEARCA